MSTDQTTRSTRSSNWRIIYTNIFGIGFGDNDVRLMCGFDMDIGKPGAEVLEEATIVMTPRSAKMLSYTLDRILELHESTFGQIPLDPARVARVDEMLGQRGKKDETKKTD
jgi:hypothetical protein